MSLTAAENNGTTLYDLSNRGVVRLPNGMGDLIGVVIVATMTCLLVLTFIMTAIEQGTPISSVAIGFAVFGVTMAGLEQNISLWLTKHRPIAYLTHPQKLK